MTSGNQNGMALVLAIMLLLVLFVMGSTLLMLATTDVKIASHQMRDNKALFVADAGIQEVLGRITSDILYIGDTVEFVRPDWQSEIYAEDPPAGSGDTLRFLSFLGDSGLNYADPIAPVTVHYLKEGDGDVIYYDPDTKERVSDTPLPPGVVPIHVAEATGMAYGGVYPVRRKAITEFIVSRLDYEVFDYALHTGGDIYFRGVSSTTNGRLSTFSAYSDNISILRFPAPDGDTIFIDADDDNDYQSGSEAAFFTGDWGDPYDIMQMPRSWKIANPLPTAGPPDLSTVLDEGFIFSNGSIIIDTIDTFIPKFSWALTVGLFGGGFSQTESTYVIPPPAMLVDPFPVPLINMSPEYWRYQGAEIIDRLHPESIPGNWKHDSLGYHWRGGGGSQMEAGTYFFSDDNVIIDEVFDPDGDVKIITPFSVYISNDVTYEESSPKIIAFLAGEDIGIGGNMANVIVKALLYSKKGDLIVSIQAVILGTVIIGGDTEISYECAMILDKRLNAVFEFVEPDKKYVSTVLSWREVRP